MQAEKSTSFHNFRYAYRTNIEHKEHCVLLLGGALQSMNSWNNYLQRYGEHFDSVICDLPGMGESDLLPHDYPIEFLADCIKHLLDEINVERVSIKAVSYASPIAFVFAKKYPEHVSRIVLGGTMNRIPDDVIDNTLESIQCLRDGDLEKAVTLFTKMFICVDRQDDIVNSKLAQKLLGMGVRKISPARRSNYIENTQRLLNAPRDFFKNAPNTPFLVFTGEYDTYTKPEYCYEVAQDLPFAEYTVVKKADHLANLEQFETVSELCYEFLAGHDISHIHGCDRYINLRAQA
jgi:pimeloyl-ACP methyl ester carboxylesterase